MAQCEKKLPKLISWPLSRQGTICQSTSEVVKGQRSSLEIQSHIWETSSHVRVWVWCPSVCPPAFQRWGSHAVQRLLLWYRGDPSHLSQWAAVTPCTSAVVVVLMRYFPSLTLPPTGPFVYDRVCVCLCVYSTCMNVSNTFSAGIWCGPTDSQNMI